MVKCYLILSLFGTARHITDGIGECENCKSTVIYPLVANECLTMNLKLKKFIQNLATEMGI